MAPITGKIKGPGLTKEAAEALANQANGPTVTSSVEDDNSLLEFDSIGAPLFDEDESGDGIDDSPLHQKAAAPPDARDAKAGIPTIDEWMDFWSRIVLRVGCDFYIDLAFRGVDENALTDREIERLQMTDEERRRIGVPIAEFSHKSKFMRKHGRMIVASGGLFDAVVAMGKWASRVNRIARRHKPKTVSGRVVNDRTGQTQPASDGPYPQGANGGNVGGGFTIVNPGG